MKTSELTGAALDWAVARCDGVAVDYDRMNLAYNTPDRRFADKDDPERYEPHNNWEQGGPIIERERISVSYYVDHIPDDRDEAAWFASLQNDEDGYGAVGDTALIAAMRCYVASKLGSEVDIPEELK